MTIRFTSLRFLLPVFLLVLPVGCATILQEPAKEATINGSVTYRERMALPPQAKLHLALYRSPADDSRKLIVENETAIQGQIPFAFKLTGIPVDVPCELEASILANDEALFATPKPIAVRAGDTDVPLLLHRVLPENDTAAPVTIRPSAKELADKDWVLVTLKGEPAQKFSDQPEVHLLFAPESEEIIRISGSDGCNRLVGIAELTRDEVHFSQLGSTMMLCPAGGEQARAFTQALAQTTDWRFSNTEKNRLELLQGSTSLIILEAKDN